MKGIQECRKEFTKNMSNTKPINASFSEAFLENPGLCVDTYFPKEADNEHFFVKEDFTALLKKKLPTQDNHF